ncbi:MAG: HNH endonuclease signature motif containing protein [Geminicoccaceae bacterium]
MAKTATRKAGSGKKNPGKKKPGLPVETRVVLWLVTTLLWRLPKNLLRLLGRIVVWLVRSVRRKAVVSETADQFYRSHRWRRLRVDALEANRARYGLLACECCGMVDVRSWHVDHIYPRSTHPELALDPDNLQVLCDACNIGKGTAYTTNWRGGPDPRTPKTRGWRKFWAR